MGIVSSGNVGGTGGPDQTPNSDDEDTRPYKCEPCNKAFRISGHLARHMKSELHLKRMQELREVGYEGSVASFPPQMTRPMTHPLVPVAMANGYPEFAGSFPVPVDDDFGMGEDPDGTDASRPFRCEICNTAFRFQGHLDRHMRSTTHHSMQEAVQSDVRPAPLLQ